MVGVWLLGWLLMGECGPGNWGGWWLGEGTPVPEYYRYATSGRDRGREDGKSVKYQKQICPLSTIVLEFILHQQYWPAQNIRFPPILGLFLLVNPLLKHIS